MEQIKVSELASEFELQDKLVISELKKIGVWVPSPDTPVDQDIANRIRRRLQLMVELEQEETGRAEKAKEKTKEKAPIAKARKTIKQLGKPRKRAKTEEEEVRSPESPLAQSLKPRKGKASYRKIEPPVEVSLEKTEISIEDEPIIEKVEAQLSAEMLETLTPESKVQEKAPVAEPPETIGPVSHEAEPVEQVPEESKTQPADQPVGKPEPVAPAPPKATVPPARPVTEVPKDRVSARRPEIPPMRDARRRISPPKVVRQAPPVAPPKPKETPKAFERPEFAETREIVFPETVTVKELSERLGVKSKDVLRELMQKGVMATINQTLEQKTVEDLCLLFNVIPRFVTFEESVMEEQRVEDRAEDLVLRAPVVTVMGHVDHGKTSLLDAIRQTRVAEGEAGGITQHIGAYHVEAKGRRIVFLDTPGHEAFTLMRARGAKATDIVVLVVAADDGVMPQTKEAIDHARAAGVPIVIAINKIDKPGADPSRVRQQLTEFELVSEEWGGDTVMVEVSAKAGTNLDTLLEMILLVADLQDLKANPGRPAAGVVLEAKLEKGRGHVASVLIQNGTLRIGDSFIAGVAHGKIRAMFDDRGQPVTAAGPSSAVEILGLQALPQAGESFQVVDDAAKARQIGVFRMGKLREKDMVKSSRLSLGELYEKMQTGDVKELPLVLKGDAQGSVEALQDSLLRLSSEKVKVNLIHTGVGAISESDVMLASASNAIILGFNVRPDQNVQEIADREAVEIRLYTVIYDVKNDVEQAMKGLLEPVIRETYLGKAEVRETFKVPKIGTVAGCYVLDGEIRRNSEIRLLRDQVVIYESKVQSIRRFKEDVAVVRSGYECGISIANFNDVKIGDVIEAFVKEEVKPALST